MKLKSALLLHSMFFLTPAYSENIETFDIDGIVFGSEVSSIKAAMNRNDKFDSNYLDTIYYRAHGKEYENHILGYEYDKGGYQLEANHLGKIVRFEKKISFSNEAPSWDSIKQKITSKYGAAYDYNIHITNGKAKAICYGDCIDINDWMLKCSEQGSCFRAALFETYGGTPFLELRYYNNINDRSRSDNYKRVSNMVKHQLQNEAKSKLDF